MRCEPSGESVFNGGISLTACDESVRAKKSSDGESTAKIVAENESSKRMNELYTWSSRVSGGGEKKLEFH